MLATPAAALESAPVSSARATATLITSADSYAPGKPLRLALRLRIADGWHSYWINPGDAGAAATLDVAGITMGALTFPAPKRETEGQLTSYALRGEVVIGATATPKPDATGPLTLSADATWLVCKNICVPEEGHFSLTLPAGTGAAGAQAAIFAASDAKLPKPPPWQAHVDANGMLWLEGSNAGMMREAYFFSDTQGLINPGAEQAVIGIGNQITLKLPFAKAGSPPKALSGVLHITGFYNAETDYTLTTTPKDMPGVTMAPLPGSNASPTHAHTTTGIWQAALLALAGGLVLNLMPCVLPVLAMKAMALAKLSGAGRRAVRREAALYSAGVIAAFMAIGGFTIAIGYLGGNAGWGTQFQSLVFTAATAWVLLAIGLNLSGVYTIGAGIAGAGQGLAARGSFFTGLLAVVVATPCTAPFMGTAIAAALAAPAAIGMVIFAALGVGLAAPMLLLAAAPHLALKILPKPGAWMENLRQILAFPMYGAALWLVWVAAQQAAAQGLALVLAGTLLVGFAAFAFGRAQTTTGSAQNGLTAWVLACLMAVGGAGFVLHALASAPAHGAQTGAPDAYSPERLATLRAAGRPVFVDAGAAWCVSCLVNEQVALNTDAVRAAFKAHDVAFLKADWTRADPVVSAFLREHGADGVPLYVFYPRSGAPVVLPQVLTPGLVVAAVNAGG